MALGDSVTSAFGFYPGGGSWPGTSFLLDCVILKLAAHGLCQSPAVVAYPAQYARMMRLSPTVWENDAQWGATVHDWLDDAERSADDPVPPGELDHILSEHPSLTVLTVGADPYLSDVVDPTRNSQLFRCINSAHSANAVQQCVAQEVDHPGKPADLVTSLANLYRRLLSVSENHLVVMQYHMTVPLRLLFGTVGASDKTAVVLEELNKRVLLAVRQVRQEVGSRIVLANPDEGGGLFSDHPCVSLQPWVLLRDTCIHPNTLGHGAFARALAVHAPDPFRPPH